uniref:Activator of Hsp90 ATPase AHSA1-like N-terminal domain-containing protein n=1 Tax=Bos indicus x Bos taurus TaxID=30522 RepID=A0A4W2CBD7_BOBOX
ELSTQQSWAVKWARSDLGKPVAQQTKCSGSDPGRTEGRQRGRFPPAPGCCSQAPLTQRPPLPTLEAITAVIIVSRGEASGLPEAADVPPSRPLHSQVPWQGPEPPQTPPGLQGRAPASRVASPQRRGSDLSPNRSRRRPPPGSPRPRPLPSPAASISGPAPSRAPTSRAQTPASCRPSGPSPRPRPSARARSLSPGAPQRGGRGRLAQGRGFLALSGLRERSAPGFAGRKRRRRSRTAAAAVPCSPPRPRRHADMAKWGQGDPRWIVEEREDGTNVNNWHWTERDATSWSKGRLRELLVGITVENEAGRCEISELKQVEGEASCSSRKGKLIFFYEWNIKLGWKGIIRESGAKHKGLIEIPSLSEENEVDDTEVNVSKKKGDGDILKDLMKTAGTAKVREALGDYLKALKTEFTMGMILPTKAMAAQELTVERKLSENALQIQASSRVALGVRIPTVALHMTELFDTAIEQLYRIFTVKDVSNISVSGIRNADTGREYATKN